MGLRTVLVDTVTPEALAELQEWCDDGGLTELDPGIVTALIAELRAARSVIGIARRAANHTNRHIPSIGRLFAAIENYDRLTK